MVSGCKVTKEKIFMEVCRSIEEITNGTCLASDIEMKTPIYAGGLGLSSIDVIDLIVKSESIFNIEVPNATLSFDSIITIDDFVDLIYSVI